MIDVPKNEENVHDGHGSKIIVIPFDGVAMDKDLQAPSALSDSALPPVSPAPLLK